MSEQALQGPPGMDTSDHVLAFFRAKNHKYLTFKLADVLEMPEDDQLLFLDVATRVNGAPLHNVPPDASRRWRIQRLGHRGYLTISIDALCSIFSIEELQAVQAVCYSYRDVRQGKFEPSKVVMCGCEGRRADCPECEGSGKTTVLLEMSDLETALAEGKSWTQIDKEGLA